MFLSVRFLIENALNNNFVPYKFEQISRYFRKSCKNLERKGFNSPLKRQQLLEHYPFLTITSCSDTRVILVHFISIIISNICHSQEAEFILSYGVKIVKSLLFFL